MEIERREHLSYEEFDHSYQRANKPVLVTDAIRSWPALSRWSPEFFKGKFGGMKFTFEHKQDRQAGYKDVKKTENTIELTMAELIDRVLASSDEAPAPYLRNQVLRDIFPSLRPDIEPLPPYFQPNWLPDRYLVKTVGNVLNRGAEIELYIGGKGGAFPVLHYDGVASHAFLMQIYGKKRFILYSPDQERFLYPSPEKPNHSMVDVDHPDLARFPLFANAVQTTVILEPGDLLFVPSRWWHTTKMLTPSISISINTANQSNWQALVDYVARRGRNPLVSMGSRMYLTGAGALRSFRDRNGSRRLQNNAD